MCNFQLMSLLLKQPHSSMFLPYMQSIPEAAETKTTTKSLPSNKKPYRCNVCRLSYAISSTLDTHLRSFAHQSRMQRLHELVEHGEVNPQRPVSEQPGGIPQKLIAELIDAAKPSFGFLASNGDSGGDHPTDLSVRKGRHKEVGCFSSPRGTKSCLCRVEGTGYLCGARV